MNENYQDSITIDLQWWKPINNFNNDICKNIKHQLVCAGWLPNPDQQLTEDSEKLEAMNLHIVKELLTELQLLANDATYTLSRNEFVIHLKKCGLNSSRVRVFSMIYEISVKPFETDDADE